MHYLYTILALPFRSLNALTVSVALSAGSNAAFHMCSFQHLVWKTCMCPLLSLLLHCVCVLLPYCFVVWFITATNDSYACVHPLFSGLTIPAWSLNRYVRITSSVSVANKSKRIKVEVEGVEQDGMHSHYSDCSALFGNIYWVVFRTLIVCDRVLNEMLCNRRTLVSISLWIVTEWMASALHATVSSLNHLR